MITVFLSIVETIQGKRLFEYIYYNHRNQMYFVANSILQDKFLAEDAVQDALLGVAKTVDKIHFEHDSAIKSYVLTAAKRAALTILESEKKIVDGYNEIQYLTPVTTMDASDRVSQRETLKELIDAIQFLPQQYQDILFYTLEYDMDCASIAELFNKPPGTIRKQLSRARQMLIDICQKEMIEIEI